MILTFYKDHHEWFFDDPTQNIIREQMVLGADDIIEELSKGYNTVTLDVDTTPFPQCDIALKIIGEDVLSGTWYMDLITPDRRVWLCPTLGVYFSPSPENIYARVVK